MAELRTIRAGGAVPIGTALAALWDQREVVRAFAVRSVRIRYRQAVFGVAWAVAQPLALLLPYLWFFRRDGEGAVAATLAALIGWQYLSQATTNGAGALVNEAVLVRKTAFAREAPVVAAVGAAGVELAVGLVLFVVAGPLLGARWGWATVPGALAGVLGLAVVALACSLPLAALNAQYRDVRHALPFAVLVWLFVSPVFFPLDGRRRLLLAVLNPAAGPLETLRRALAGGEPPTLALPLSLGTATVIGVLGYRWFRRQAPTLADVL
ncbi:MAG: ABC transporter permease [Acidimicrobiales bacterium]|nr:ABC transporter permease [Acidimicrobiales bacterium]